MTARIDGNTDYNAPYDVGTESTDGPAANQAAAEKSQTASATEAQQESVATSAGAPSGPPAFTPDEVSAKSMFQWKYSGPGPGGGQGGGGGQSGGSTQQTGGAQQTAGPSAGGSKFQSRIDDLEDAARQNDIKKMQALIKSGVDVNAIGSDGKTALMAAAEMGTTDAMKLLLGSGARVDETTADGKTALMAAANTNQSDSIDLLLQNKANVNSTDKAGNTAVMIAAGRNNTDAIQSLAAGKADLNHQNGERKTALILAAENGNNDAVEALAKAGADPTIQDKNKNTALMTLIQQAHDKEQQTGQRVKPDRTAVKALINASKPADLDVKDKDNKTAMMRAAAFGDKDVVVALAEAKADPDIQDANGRTAIMDLLGRSPATGSPTLSQADTLSASEAKTLVAASHKPDLQDKNGRTALMEAANQGHYDMAVALVQSHRVDVDKQDHNGRTALMELGRSQPATGNDPLPAAKSLIDASKNLNLKDKNGTTALIQMSQGVDDDFSDVVKELNKKGADLNAQDKYGKTALMYAASHGNKWTTRYLLDQDFKDAGHAGLRKADPSVKDKQGETALSLTQKQLANPQGLSDEDKNRLNAIIDMLKAAPIPPHSAPPQHKNSTQQDWKP